MMSHCHVGNCAHGAEYHRGDWNRKVTCNIVNRAVCIPLDTVGLLYIAVSPRAVKSTGSRFGG